MKFTDLGRDYHMAALLLSGAGLATGETLFAALALGMAFTSLISIALLRQRAPRAVDISLADSRARTFKNEEAALTLVIPGLRGTWAGAEVESVKFDGPAESTMVVRVNGEVSLVVRPKSAGRLGSAEVRLRLTDALGLFSLRRVVSLPELVVDSLPVSLLAPAKSALVPPLAVGERPGRAAGRGQEFHGIEIYTERSESKDILWKRAAKEPYRPLLARVREADNPEYVTLDVVHGDMVEGHRITLVDLQCEALGVLGRSLLLAGVRPKIVGPDGTVHLVDTEEELAESIMQVSVPPRAVKRDPRMVAGPGVLLAVGDLDEDAMIGTGRRPTVLVGDEHRQALDRYGVTYKGTEDLTGIINLVLAL